MKTKHYTSIFLSDVHLGFHGCRAEELTRFLKHSTCDNLFLLGDILDIFALRSRFYWPDSHTRLVRAILKVAAHSKQTVYTPGNHDWLLKNDNGVSFGNILIKNEFVYKAKNGKSYLLLHGDKHDGVLAQNKYLVLIGCFLYDWLLFFSTKISQLRRAAGRVHWSLSKYLKSKVKSAVNYVGDYEATVVADAKRHGVSGVICGHIHTPGILQFGDIEYLNCGDFVENLSCIVEHTNGEFEVLTYKD